MDLKTRKFSDVPEGGSHILSCYKNENNTEEIHETLTKEWFVTYANSKTFWEDKIFLVHAKTIEGAFEHFITIKPDTVVKQIRFYGIYFNHRTADTLRK